MLLLNPSLGLIVALALIIFVALPFHEFAHALAAYRLGDGTAKLFGRLTLNPLAHVDPIGALLIVLVGFGWAKPTPVNPLNLRGGRQGEALVAFAGPASNLVLAAAAAIPLRYAIATDLQLPEIVFGMLQFFIQINLVLMVFNLLPIPPLDGSKVAFALMDRRTEMQWRPVLEQYGFLILIAVAFLPILPGGTILDVVFDAVVRPLFRLLVGI
ncbi:MAG TPA: site-2 protease family protein [Candidatus Limnocylindrales bacterium]